MISLPYFPKVIVFPIAYGTARTSLIIKICRAIIFPLSDVARYGIRASRTCRYTQIELTSACIYYYMPIQEFITADSTLDVRFSGYATVLNIRHCGPSSSQLVENDLNSQIVSEARIRIGNGQGDKGLSWIDYR